MFRRKSSSEQLPPLRPADTEAAAKVLDTISGLEHLRTEDLLLVGSAASALYGIDLPNEVKLPLPFPGYPQEIQIVQRPGDVDFAISAQYAQDVHDEKMFSGLSVRRKEHRKTDEVILHASEHSLPLAIDLIARYDGRDTLAAYDEMFRARLQAHSREIAGLSNGIRVATPDYLLHELRKGSADEKRKRDLLIHKAYFRTKK